MRRYRLILLLVCAAGALVFWLLRPTSPAGPPIDLYTGNPVPYSTASRAPSAPFSSTDPNPPATASRSSTPARPTPTPIPRVALGQPALDARPARAGVPSSPFSRELADPALAPAAAPKVVLKMFDAYRSRFGGYPSGGDNRQFVNALTGNNPQGLPILDRTSPLLSPSGELLDGWSTPYFFHLIDRNYIEIRSAGPDKVMYTADDVVVAPARGQGQ